MIHNTRFKIVIVVITVAACGVACKREDESARLVNTENISGKQAPAATESAGNTPASAKTAKADVSLGRQAWDQGKCAKCHADGGTGTKRAPDLTDAEWFHCDGSVEGIRKVLMSGVSREDMHNRARPFSMNPATNLVPDEKMITALAEFVHSLGQAENE